MRFLLAFVTAALVVSCAATQKPATQTRAGDCLIQQSEAVTRVSNELFGFALDLPFEGWKVECGKAPRVFFAYSPTLGLHVTGEVLEGEGKPSAEKLLRAVYAIARDKAQRTGTRVGEAEFETDGGKASLRYEVHLDNPNVPDAQRTNIRSIHEFKPLETSQGELLLLHVSWTGSNDNYEELRNDLSMPIRTFIAPR